MKKLLLFIALSVFTTGAFSQNKAAPTSKPRGNARQAQKDNAAAQSKFSSPKYRSLVKGKMARKAKGG